MSRILDVYLHEKMAGTLAQNENGQLVFKYNSNYLDSNGMAISVSMPLRDEPYPDRIARPYFAGLLPDERARRRLAAVLGVSFPVTARTTVARFFYRNCRGTRRETSC